MENKIMLEYERWLKNCANPEVLEELKSIGGDEKAISDRFYSALSFGTGGLRGVIGAGTNRMNVYTVGRATRGFARYLCAHFASPSAAIAHDNRKNSDAFTREAACILAASGVKVYLYRELMPTPMLSYAVRELGCSGGIVITASHNPGIYNGYKVYGPDGCQLTDDGAHEVEAAIGEMDYFGGKTLDFEKGLKTGQIEYISDALIDQYLSMVSSLAPGDAQDAASLKIVYTPLNGTGRMPVTRVLAMNGFSDVTVVPEQEMPDAAFPTCPYPNPEIREALEKGLELMKKTNADLLLATDPDCDRVGTAVWEGKEQRLISGNEMGVLLLDYICRKKKKDGTMPGAPVAIKTIVTTDMARRVAEHYGVEMRDVLTGFKYIGEQIGLMEKEGHPERYLLGFEESYGYLTGTAVRDKDGVNAALVICRMCAYYKQQGKTLSDALKDAEKCYGAFRNLLENHAFPGQDGMVKMGQMMDALRKAPPREVMGLKLTRVQDFETHRDVDVVSGHEETLTLPTSNVLKFYYSDHVTMVVRPSGTEPKLKIYHAVRGETPAQADALLSAWQAAFAPIMQGLRGE